MMVMMLSMMMMVMMLSMMMMIILPRLYTDIWQDYEIPASQLDDELQKFGVLL